MSGKKHELSWGRFDFMSVAKYITIGSVGLSIVALLVLGVKGLNYGVDFAGGIELQVQFNQKVDAAKVRQFMESSGFGSASVQAIGDEHEFLIRVEAMKNPPSEDAANAYITDTVAKIRAGLATQFTQEGANVRRVDTVGPQIGAELKRNGILAGFYCLMLILIYVGLRFDFKFAAGAVFCLFHDALITMGIYSLFGWEFGTPTLAAILTIIGYSLNDTIVIFDRIRENVAIHRDQSFFWIANRSINETLSRTILTYVTTYMTVIPMYIFADGVIKDFALTMMIGMFLGAYSTIYVATPLVIVAERFQAWNKQRRLQTA
jgi:preprotein translocase subunit SecF